MGLLSRILALVCAGALLAGVGCSEDGDSEPTPPATPTDSPTPTASPTSTATATLTPSATESATPEPTATPGPSRSIEGLFTEPRETMPDATWELGPRPPSPFEDWNRTDVVLYDIEAMTELNLGPGGFAVFSPDGSRLAWVADEGGVFEEIWLLELGSGARRSLGPGRAIRWVDDEALVAFLPGGNERELVDATSGDRRPPNGANLNPDFRPVEAVGWQLDRVESGEYPLWSSTYELTDLKGIQDPLRFDAMAAVLASDGTLFIVLSPEDTDLVGAEFGIEIGLSNIFAVDPGTGEAAFIATALATAPNSPFVATEAFVAWTDDACGLTDEQHGTRIYDRASGSLTEVVPRQWPVCGTEHLVGVGSFGPNALLDVQTLEYTAVLPEGVVDVSWTEDLRYAAVGAVFGHGGLCG